LQNYYSSVIFKAVRYGFVGLTSSTNRPTPYPVTVPLSAYPGG